MKGGGPIEPSRHSRRGPDRLLAHHRPDTLQREFFEDDAEGPMTTSSVVVLPQSCRGMSVKLLGYLELDAILLSLLFVGIDEVALLGDLLRFWL
ncbi:unnamed protein product [Sphagnum balticum]